jgi:hypothetical protein
MSTSTKVYARIDSDEFFIKTMLKMQDQPLDKFSPLLTKRIDDLKTELGEAMKVISEIENKSLMASRSVSPIATPSRSRSITNAARRIRGLSAFTRQAGTGVKSRTLTSTLPNVSGIKGPFITDISTADYPAGDDMPLDPCADDDVQSSSNSGL